MVKLNRALLNSNFDFPSDVKVAPASAELPEKVLQFGEGNFLRAFVDWMFHQLNTQGLFQGSVVLVQPIKEGLTEKINAQDGLYTLLLRGLKEGKAFEQKEVIQSVSRCLNPYDDWKAVLNCAESSDLEFIVSNTTEAGIVFREQDRLSDCPPVSYPGKLTALLYQRFTFFKGDKKKGLVIIPCELIDRNGDNLKKAVFQFADLWNLSDEFKTWLQESNQFLNTLVDRVVTGYPRDDIKEITQYLGYEDDLVDTGEIFHLWVIEGPKKLAERLPFTKIGLNVIWTNDMTPYRTRKVRILNGAHTASIPAAFLYGLETVGELMDHEVLGRYIRQLVYEEIIPSIDLDKAMLKEFADAVVERFQNPYIHHYLLSILLNSSSKFKARVLPSILEYQKLHHTLPEKLTFSFAALIAVYKDGVIDGSAMKAKRQAGEFIMKDDLSALQFFADTWSHFDGTPAAAKEVAKTVLASEILWGQNLTALPGIVDKVGDYLYQITAQGMQATVNQLVHD